MKKADIHTANTRSSKTEEDEQNPSLIGNGASYYRNKQTNELILMTI